MSAMNRYLEMMAEQRASDIFLTANAPPMIKVEGKHKPAHDTVLSGKAVDALARSMMTEEQRQRFDERFELDFAVEHENVGRYRVNVFRQRGNTAVVIRYLPLEIPTLDSLHMPESLNELVHERRGLILMVGPTGSGKTTTLAAMLEKRNQEKTGHILTVEDPIEFVYSHGKGIVNQRELGTDTHAMDVALRSAVREAPDVILLGESRDYESISTCLHMAGTGHLVFSTLHASNTHQAFQRIVRMFPPTAREQLFMDMSLNLRAVLSQRLVITKSGKRRAAVEVLINTPHVADLILNGRIDEIKEIMAESGDPRIQTFDDALAQLYRDGHIEWEEALSQSDSP
ncbi:MAG: PilT/PilU family type 4a pilus ATPase, partial [Salinisphaeraceae bacterium]|nr:PilT/PilU family type 4a pilus ATPase [Salinisphaeraceae bacterium]